jgi:hypothetical protein
MKKLVIIPGGFHPFHAGHRALYDAAREAFPSAEVYIAATADTSTRPFPIEAKKKLARLAGIPQNRFIQVKSPFSAKEITDHYDPDDTVLIFARSEKDRETNPQAGGVKKDGTPTYLQPFKRNGLQPMKRHAYMVYLPTVQFGPGISSATEIRAKWPGMTPQQKARLVNQLYPDTEGNDQLTSVVVRLFDETMDQKEIKTTPADKKKSTIKPPAPDYVDEVLFAPNRVIETERSITGQIIEPEIGYYSIWVRRPGQESWTPITKYPDQQEAQQVAQGLRDRGLETMIREDQA